MYGALYRFVIRLLSPNLTSQKPLLIVNLLVMMYVLLSGRIESTSLSQSASLFQAILQQPQQKPDMVQLLSVTRVSIILHLSLRCTLKQVLNS
jgi:hypothetical protein